MPRTFGGCGRSDTRSRGSRNKDLGAGLPPSASAPASAPASATRAACPERAAPGAASRSGSRSRPRRDGSPVRRCESASAPSPGGSSHSRVTGPSLTSSTSISAPNEPVATVTPASRNLATKRSNSGSAASAGSARSKLGRRPLRIDPASVNWDTSSSSPPTSSRPRLIRPASSSKTRSVIRRWTARSSCASPSPRSRPTSTAMPVPIRPTTAPPTRTSARDTR